MQVFLERRFGKWAEREQIDDARLVETAKEAFAGQYEADLGGCLFKKRVAREGAGKSGGYRRFCVFGRRMTTGSSFCTGLQRVRRLTSTLRNGQS